MFPQLRASDGPFGRMLSLSVRRLGPSYFSPPSLSFPLYDEPRGGQFGRVGGGDGNSRRRSSESANGTELDLVTSGGLRGAGKPGLSSESLCCVRGPGIPAGQCLSRAGALATAVTDIFWVLLGSSDTLRSWEQLGKRWRSPRQWWVEWRWGLWGT